MTEAAVLKQVEKLQRDLAAAQEALADQQEFIDRVQKSPKSFAVVVELEPKPVICMGGAMAQVEPVPALKLKKGMRVLVVNSQIMEVSDMAFGGAVQTVASVIDDTFVEIRSDGSPVVLFSNGFALEAGDRVIVEGNVIVTRKLDKQQQSYRVREDTGVCWSDIGGLHDAKQEMIAAVELPHKNPAIFERYNATPAKGILLYGPPGCGKTMLGKAAATALAKLHAGASSSDGFLYIKGPEILDRYVGVAEGAVRDIFERARRFHRETGSPAVVFIDEADAILGRRGSGLSSDMERTIVPAFLTEMDGLEQSGALTILATNRPDTLDPAIVRDGRIDRKIKVTRPDIKASHEIFSMNLKGVPLHEDDDLAKVAAFSAVELFNAKRALYRIATEDGEETLTLAHLVNGALVKGVVDQAKSFALHRDLASDTFGGLRREDITRALSLVEAQNRDLDHRDAILELVGDRRVQAVYRLTGEKRAA